MFDTDCRVFFLKKIFLKVIKKGISAVFAINNAIAQAGCNYSEKKQPVYFCFQNFFSMDLAPLLIVWFSGCASER